MAVIGKIRSLGWVLILIIVIALVSFLLMDIGGSGNNGRVVQSNEIATVNGTPISNIDFQKRVDLYKDNANGALSVQELEQIKEQAWNDMLREQLTAEKYEQLGVTVSEAEFNDMLFGDNPSSPTRNQQIFGGLFFNPQTGQYDKQYVEYHSTNLDIEQQGEEPGTKRKRWNQIEKYLLDTRLNNKFSALISKALVAPDWMANMEYNNQQSKVTFDYVALPFTDVNSADITVTDADLNAYLKTHAKEFTATEETRNLKFVSFPVVASAQDSATALNWITDKQTEFTTTDNDSVFVNLYSDKKFDFRYKKESEIALANASAIFNAEEGAIVGPYLTNGNYELAKLLEKTKIADSVKASVIVLQMNLQSQEKYDSSVAVADSVFKQIDSLNKPYENYVSLSADADTKADNGNLGWLTDGDFNALYNVDYIDAWAFHRASQGSVEAFPIFDGQYHVATLIIKLNKANKTTDAVKVAYLSNPITISRETTTKIYSDASTFAGENNTKEAFEASAAVKKPMLNVKATSAFNYALPGGSIRDITRWAYTAKVGDISQPLSTGNEYVVALLESVSPKGAKTAKDFIGLEKTNLENLVKNEKKAEQLKAKVSGDLASIASANGKQVQTASNVSFDYPSFNGLNEPAVVGAASLLTENAVSKPIVGKQGVYVVMVKQKTAPTTPAVNLTAQKQSVASKLQSASFGVFDALVKDANVEDNRANFF